MVRLLVLLVLLCLDRHRAAHLNCSEKGIHTFTDNGAQVLVAVPELLDDDLADRHVPGQRLQNKTSCKLLLAQGHERGFAGSIHWRPWRAERPRNIALEGKP